MIEIFFDGGSRGNPGDAAGAAIIKLDPVVVVSEFLNNATNNEAEYMGLIVGLKKAIELGIEEINVFGDSNLVISQVHGSMEVRADHLAPLCGEAQELLRCFKKWELSWIPRDRNSEADTAVNAALDEATGLTVLREIAKTLPTTDPLPKLADKIRKLIKLGNAAKFKDYMSLKSGNDIYSRKKLDTLRAEIPQEVQDALALTWKDVTDEYLAKIFRWYLRGLPIDLAVRKVKTDLEITENVIGVKKAVFSLEKDSHIDEDLDILDDPRHPPRKF